VELSGALQVTGLVLVDDVELSNLIQQGGYLREQCLSGALVGRVAQSLHGVAGRLVEQTVVCALRCGLANALLRRLMVCHNLINVFYFLTFVVCLSVLEDSFGVVRLVRSSDYLSCGLGRFGIGFTARSVKKSSPVGTSLVSNDCRTCASL